MTSSAISSAVAGLSLSGHFIGALLGVLVYHLLRGRLTDRAKENRATQAEFRCTGCGHAAHADVNAAINILRAGLALRDAAAA